MQYEIFILVYASKSKTSIRGGEVNRLGRTPFAEKKEKRHLSLPASAKYLLQHHCIFSVRASFCSDTGYDSGDAAGGAGGEEARAMPCDWNAALSLYTRNSSWQSPALSQRVPATIPKKRALLLKASHAIADPHHMSPRGSAVAGGCAERLERASGHLPAPRNHLGASLCSKYLSYITLIRTDATLYF